MRLFVYNYRDYDEETYFKKYGALYNAELTLCSDSPSMENLERLQGFDAVSIITTPTGRDVLKKMKEMGIRCVATRSIGVNHIDLKAAEELGITVCNAVYPPDSVANYAIMLMLMCCRKVIPTLKRAEIQDFSLPGKKGKEISVSTVGVMGTGRIGRTVIRHLSGFGCRILAYDLYENDEVKKYAQYVDRETLLKESDILTLHMPYTEENYHLVDERAFAQMKEGAILINTARGELIDTQALIAAVQSGKIGAAGLDVIEQETGLYYANLMDRPLANGELAVLNSFPNVIVTPHTAFYTDEAVGSMIQSTIEGCCLALEGKENPYAFRG